MSASKDRKLRKEQIAAGTDKRSLAEAKAKAERRKTNITYSIVAAVLVIFFAFIFIYNSAIPSRNTTAVTIDGQDYSVAQLNFYYSNAYMNFYNNNYYYVAMGMIFDPNESLADQEYSEGYSWRDYFLDAAVDNMRQVQMLNDQAEAAGFTLSAEEQAEYDEAIANMQTSWEAMGYSSLAQYLNLNYGKGVDEQMVIDEMYRLYVASAYSEQVAESYEYTTEELDAYYADHADELDVINYMYYVVSDDTVDAQTMAEALNGTDADTFTEALAENVEGAVPTTQSLAGGSLSDVYADWLLDAARQSGDATAIESDGATYVVMFLGRDDNSYPLVSFRHILITAEDTDEDGELSQEEIDAAAAEANDLYEQWLAGDATEDSFAELANQYSDDGGSNTTGGLYEDVYQGQMVEPINDWLFEEGRQVGDTVVVSNDGSYTGTHVVYFVGADDLTFAQVQADGYLRSDAYNAWLEENLANYEATTSHLKMAGKNH